MKNLAATVFYIVATICFCGMFIFVVLTNVVGNENILIDYRVGNTYYQATFDDVKEAERFIEFLGTMDTVIFLGMAAQ